MIKLPSIVTLLSLCAVLIGCAGDGEAPASKAVSTIEVPEGWVLYDVSSLSYSLVAPVGWELDTTGKMNTAMILFTPADSTNDYFKENVNLMVDDVTGKNLNIDAYMDQSVGLIQKFITDLEDFEARKENGEYWLTYKGRQGTLKAYYYQRLMMKGQMAYILTYTSIDGKPSQSHSIAQEIIQRFTLR